MTEGRKEPIFNVPGVVAALACVLVAIHVGREWLSTAGDAGVVDLLSFNPARYGGARLDLPGEPWAGPVNFVSHALLHGDFTHLAVNTAWLLAVGSPIARRMPAGSFLAFFALCAAGGALVFLGFHWGLETAVVGASGAISGLMAARFRLMFAAVDEEGRTLLRENPAAAPCLSVRAVLTGPRSGVAILAWVAVNFIAAIALAPLAGGGGIAWEAHLGGFFTGLFAFDLFDRGRGEEPGA